ncbi:MAG TPA: GGDEF domain-containing protein, partial [Terracidiphilus sp.]|nr:GGDEF domain-containing protein [Terracidiphilus sp.]
MSLDLATEISQTPTFNFVPGFQIFFSMLYGVPLLVAVSLPSDNRIWGMARTINAVLSVATGAVLYLEIFTLLTAAGSRNPGDAVLIARAFDAIDVFLAAAATLRWLGSNEFQEYRFFRILSIFLWINAVLPSIHNRIILGHDYIWLDLLISAPYAVLFVLIRTAQQLPAKPPSPGLVRAVRSGSPIFLTMALVSVGIVASRSHFYVGLAAVLLAIAAYGGLNIFAQSRGLETEETLLASKERLERLINVDSLTGIANRHAFDKALEREVAAVRRTRMPLSLLMIDVDHFKRVNDEKGHQVGDEYLVRIAAALQMALPRATDFVARYGGEEFSVILSATDKTGAMNTARKLHQCIADLGLCHTATSFEFVTISIGFSTYDGSFRHSPASLVRAADSALYLAKRSGRNRSDFISVDDDQE